MTFGEKLQDLRRKAGMSQDTLAERLDVSRQAVSKWERDETMPETEKLVRIAQLFGASLDELLLDREPQKAPDPQPQPQPVYRPNYVNQFRRHGYKLGYILIAIGALICVFCLVMRLVMPAIGNSFMGSASDFMSDFADNAMSSFNPFGDAEIVWEGGEPLTPDEEQAILDAIGGGNSGVDHLWDSTVNQMDSMVDSALQAQANMFLIGLIPGGVLIVAGLFIVIKGKKIAANTCEV